MSGAALSDAIAPGAVLVVADLHLDVWKRTGRDPLDALGAQEWAGFAAVIVAGDLSNDPERKWRRHLGRLAGRVGAGRLHVLPGNHDYYGIGLGEDDRLRAICAELGVSFAQQAQITVGRRRFLCATLWTGCEGMAGTETSDFRRIAGPSGGVLRPADIAALHQAQCNWLASALDTPWEGETVVVTHHAPMRELLTPGHQPASAYAADLDALALTRGAAVRGPARRGPALWLYGHTHHGMTLRSHETEFRNVSFGLPKEVEASSERSALLRGLCP